LAGVNWAIHRHFNPQKFNTFISSSEFFTDVCHETVQLASTQNALRPNIGEYGAVLRIGAVYRNVCLSVWAH